MEEAAKAAAVVTADKASAAVYVNLHDRLHYLRTNPIGVV
jgi:hypothetical protein